MVIRFDLRHLRYFVTVAETKSFRKADELLHLSQPPLSRQIKDLEQVLGAELFVREKQGIVLTPAGESLLPRARKLLRDAESLMQLDAGPGAAARGMKIGMTIAVPPQTLARLTEQWRLQQPNVQIETGYSGVLLHKLRKGRLDAALVGLPADTTGLHVTIIGNEPLMIAMPAAHPAARKREVSLLDVADSPLFWWSRAHNPAYYEFCWQWFVRLGYHPEVIEVEPGQYVTLERIGSGEGVTLMNSSREKTRVKGVVYRPLKEGRQLGFDIAMLWKPAMANAGLGALAELALREWGGN